MEIQQNKGCLMQAALIIGAMSIFALIAELGAGGIITLCAIGAGGWLLYKKIRSDAELRSLERPTGVANFKIRDEADAERAVLMVARAHGGIATVAQIVLESPLSSEQADRTLERLRKRGLAHPELDENGCVHYHFAGLLKQRTSLDP